MQQAGGRRKQKKTVFQLKKILPKYEWFGSNRIDKNIKIC
jgi:hypothetical protein